MKLSVPIFIASTFAMSSSTLSSAASSSSSSVLRGSRNSSSNNNNANDFHQEHRVLEEGIDGTFLVKVIEYPDEARRNLQGNSDNMNPNKSQEIAYSIQTSDGLIYDIEDGSENWEVGLVSGADSIAIPAGATMLPNGKIKMNGLKPNKVDSPGQGKGLFGGRNLREQPTPEQQANLDKLNGGRRDLAVVTGTKTVYAVRIVHDGTSDTSALTALEPSYTLATLSDDVFGTRAGGTDLVNLASQYFACSHGKLDINPIGPRTSGNSKVTNIANGVVEVTVSSACTSQCDGTLRNEVTNALNSAFGSASSVANHAMYCMPPGAMGGIAYAYVNSWNSVYDDNWCRYTSAQVSFDKLLYTHFHDVIIIYLHVSKTNFNHVSPLSHINLFHHTSFMKLDTT